MIYGFVNEDNGMRRKIWFILAFMLAMACLTGCSGKKTSQKAEDGVWHGLAFDCSMELMYADQFAVDYYKGGYARISIVDGGEFLLVP